MIVSADAIIRQPVQNKATSKTAITFFKCFIFFSSRIKNVRKPII